MESRSSMEAAASTETAAAIEAAATIEAAAMVALGMTSAPTMTTGVGKWTKREYADRDKPDQNCASSYHTCIDNQI